MIFSIWDFPRTTNESIKGSFTQGVLVYIYHFDLGVWGMLTIISATPRYIDFASRNNPSLRTGYR
jgi:hypothetical protein